jgi:hypothetical protein
MGKEQYNLQNQKVFQKISTEEDKLVKIIDRNLEELKILEELLDEGGELSKVYAAAFRLSGFDFIADEIDENVHDELFADRNNLSYLHIPLVNIKRMLNYFKDSYQILTLEFIREVYKFNDRNKNAREEGREKLSQKSLETLEQDIIKILEEWREKYE